MGLKIYGILSAQSPDKAGETIMLDGIDTTQLTGVRDEHDADDFFHKLGAITFHKKIHMLEECENPRQVRCWNHAGVPILYIEAELANDTEHPNATAAAEMIKFCQRPEIPLQIGFSIDGGIYERRTPGGQVTEDKKVGKVISASQALEAALTSKPCHPKAGLWTMNDLLKSEMPIEPPRRYLEALKKSAATASIIESPEWKILYKTTRLRKSIEDYNSAWTELKCYKCGQAQRVFKASQLPNLCKCGASYSLSSMWKALNK